MRCYKSSTLRETDSCKCYIKKKKDIKSITEYSIFKKLEKVVQTKPKENGRTKRVTITANTNKINN